MTIDDSFNFGVETGDFTFGDKTTAAGDGAVAVGGNNSGDIVSGDGAVMGNFNTVNNGNIRTGDGSPVTIGSGNEVEATSQKAGGDIIQGNEGPVIQGVNTGGGDFDLDNSETVFGNKTDIDVKGDVNGNIDASNTHLENVGNTDNSVHDSWNTTDSYNTTGSFNSSSESGLQLPDPADALGEVGDIIDDINPVDDLVDGVGDVLDDLF